MLERPELKVGKLYRNTNNWKNNDDVFNVMFRQFSDGKGIQNAGGFRFKSKINHSKEIINAAFVLLVTSFAEHEWPDNLDRVSGIFTYFGDNRKPGKSIEDTHIGGNRFLSQTYKNVHSCNRENVSPLLCFEIVKDKYTYMKFLGLAAPGATSLSSLEDLTAVWRFNGGQRFQNYKALLTILNEEYIRWDWLDDLVEGVLPVESKNCPDSWTKWVEKGLYNARQCREKQIPRTNEQQLPNSSLEKKVLDMLLELTEREFEFAAKRLLMLMDNRFTNLRVVPGSEEEGRDVIGFYEIGHGLHKVPIEVFVEAKKLNTIKVGVKSMYRLISKLKHRNIGVFLTTSVFDEAVQKELIENKHPVLLISGGDIAKILISNDLYGHSYEYKLIDWLKSVKYEAGTI